MASEMTGSGGGGGSNEWMPDRHPRPNPARGTRDECENKVGGPFGVKDACDAVVNTLDTKVNPAVDSLKAVADDLHRILVQIESLVKKLVG